MIEYFRTNFEELSKKFSEFYTDGGMYFELVPFEGEPSLDKVREYFYKEGYVDDEVSELQCDEISFNDLLEEFQKYYKTPGISFTDDEILKIHKALGSVIAGRVLILESEGDLDCYALNFIANIGPKQFIFSFWWQYD